MSPETTVAAQRLQPAIDVLIEEARAAQISDEAIIAALQDAIEGLRAGLS